MRTPSYIILLLLALLLATFVGVLAYFTYASRPTDRRPSTVDRQTPLAPPTRPIISSQDPLRGDPAAPITIVEFGDFLCPSCAQMESVLDSILTQYKGRVKLVWKDLPNIRLHPLAQRAALAARCAQEQGAFWRYHDLLLLRQSELDSAAFTLLAQELGLNLDEFSQCNLSARPGVLLERTLNEALLLRVDATPYFFIGEKRISGAVGEALLKEAIESYAN